MIYLIHGFAENRVLALIAILLSFVLTFVFLKVFENKLPRDAGRQFAHDGQLSAGKPRGAGIIFVLVFTLLAFLFIPFSLELSIYLLLTIAAMLTGFFDDSARKPWGELKKGLLDLGLSIAVACTIYFFNSSTIFLHGLAASVTIPPVLFIFLAAILVWVSINVTNCADGVDGLSGTLTIITLGTIYMIGQIKEIESDYDTLILLLIFALLAYLWYNATPSKLLMGDAGSRAMGLFIAIAILKTGSPLLYIPAALVLIIDGGLGLAKVTIIRVFKVNLMKNIRTPIHDHVRKNLGWSNTHTVFRFAIIQLIMSFILLSLL